MTRAPFYVLALALALSGCAATPRSYDLSAAPGRSLARGTLALDIARVEPPFDGDAIVIRTTDGLERLGGAQWADGLPRLARSRVAESLENAGWRVGDVGGVRLRVEIRRFEIDSLTREARVELAAQFAGGAARGVRRQRTRGRNFRRAAGHGARPRFYPRARRSRALDRVGPLNFCIKKRKRPPGGGSGGRICESGGCPLPIAGKTYPNVISFGHAILMAPEPFANPYFLHCSIARRA